MGFWKRIFHNMCDICGKNPRMKDSLVCETCWRGLRTVVRR